MTTLRTAVGLALCVAISCSTSVFADTVGDAEPDYKALLAQEGLTPKTIRQLLAAKSSTIVRQTRGFGDVRDPIDLPPPAKGGKLPDMSDTTTSPFAASGSNARTAEKLPEQLKICGGGIRLCAGTTQTSLRGVNWFGFETSATMVAGLWQGPTAASLDFVTVVRRIKLLGFNHVRLPFSFKILYDTKPLTYRRSCPDNGGKDGQNPTEAQLLRGVTKPGVPVSKHSIALPYTPKDIIPTNGAKSICGKYLPEDTTLNRFLFVVGFLARNGIIVVIDNHLNLDPTFVESQGLWIARWKHLMNKVNADPVARRRVILDPLNEPDSYGLRWEASGSRPSVTSWYLRFMDEAYKINPNFLYTIEGLGQGAIGANWGDGLATDPAVIGNSGASSAAPFFKALLNKPYKGKVIVQVHMYPPSITLNTNEATISSPGLFKRLSNSFGYLNKKGFCYGGKCQKFPIYIGEIGSRMRDCRNRCAAPATNCMFKELRNMNLFLDYFNNAGAGADGKHERIDMWAWWAWNANSGDTGGLVRDDWVSIIWPKIDYLGKIGLRPWYYSSCGGSKCFSSISYSKLTCPAGR